MTLRRACLQAGLAAAALALPGCRQPAPIAGGFVGIEHARGHRLQQPGASAVPTLTRRTTVLIAGAGIAGLAAARALRQRGISDFAVLDLEDAAGGNSRFGQIDGIACPLGAHYLPLPGASAQVVQAVLAELGLCQYRHGRWVYDERHLCHSPQERLFLHGHWQEGLLPQQDMTAETLAQYHRFAALVAQQQRASNWPLPVSNRPLVPVQAALDAIVFDSFLNQHGLHDRYLRWYLDYCCRDDYGAGSDVVSAWAGLHYFASRHGFLAPGGEAVERDSLLTWPQGNGWLTERLALPLAERLYTGCLVQRITVQRHGIELDAWNVRTQALERWQARYCIVALPLFVAARVLGTALPALTAAAAQTSYAAWVVANLHLKQALHDRPGAPPSWDNLIYPEGGRGAAQGLGYVDAMHQSLRPVPAATVLTWYRALGSTVSARQQLLTQPWSHWRDAVLTELGSAHPDLPGKTSRIEVMRYGHAMAVPVPGARRSAAHAALQSATLLTQQRLQFAHSDLSGYSVFEEAFSHGQRAGQALAQRLRQGRLLL